MAQIKESGHYAIAGFLYQILDAGARKLEICNVPRKDGELDKLYLERFGQDAVVLADNGDVKKLIQCKYSSKDAEIQPSELRRILERLVESARALNLDLAEIRYELRTNRELSDDARAWDKAKSDSELESLIRGSTTSSLKNAAELVDAYKRFEYERRTAVELRDSLRKTCQGFGMLDNEIERGISAVIGMLLEVSSLNHREVIREDFFTKLVGWADPLSLLSEDSFNIRAQRIDDNRCREIKGVSTIPRAKAQEIAEAVRSHPLTLVVGEGGIGKTVAVCDALLYCLHDVNVAPAFAVVRKAFIAKLDYLSEELARWRKGPTNLTVNSVGELLHRLGAADERHPLLVVCLDAIDEKSGSSRLPQNAQEFINELLDHVRDEQRPGAAHRLSVILVCRDSNELDKLDGTGLGYGGPTYHPVHVGEFNDNELLLLAEELDDTVGQRIKDHLVVRGGTSQTQTRGLPSLADRGVSSESLATIRHPILWRFFGDLAPIQQHQYLDGLAAGTTALAVSYFHWFCEKSEARNQRFQPEQCRTALCAIAVAFRGEIATRGNWVGPCVETTNDPLGANQLLREALSAGIIRAVEAVDGEVRKWSWTHRWFYEFLWEMGSTQT